MSPGASLFSQTFKSNIFGRGCPICFKRRRTSFAEQAICFYLKKCEADVQSGQEDLHTGREMDIFLPSCKTMIEFNSLYCHTTLGKGRRTAADIGKAYELARYYRVFIVMESGNTLPIKIYPLIQLISVPVFALTEKICQEYDEMIYRLLKALFPGRDSYPNIDIQRDQLLILQQYVDVAVENSFEEGHPLLAADWHPEKNGTLTPSMFRVNTPYKFWRKCRKCKRSYQMSMTNRLKVNPNTCPFCCRKSRYKSPLRPHRGLRRRIRGAAGVGGALRPAERERL